MLQNTFGITDIMAWFADAICRYCKFSQAGSMRIVSELSSPPIIRGAALCHMPISRITPETALSTAITRHSTQ